MDSQLDQYMKEEPILSCSFLTMPPLEAFWDFERFVCIEIAPTGNFKCHIGF